MSDETTQNTLIEPFEINEISAKLPPVREETKDESNTVSPKKPRETKVFNHGTGYVTFVQATKLITASRSTLARYANEGKVSFETDDNGHKWFQIVELERVFGKLKSPETTETSTDNEEKDHLIPEQPDNETALRIASLEADKRVLETLLEAEREKRQLVEKNAEDLRQAMKMLTFQPAPTPTAAPEPEPPAVPPKKKLFGIFGGR